MKLKQGDRFPEWRIATIRGDEVRIPDADAGLVHIQFRRYAGCPICNFHLRGYVTRADEIKRAGIREVVVFHSSKDAMVPYQGQLPFDSIADPEKKLYAQCGVEASVRAVMHPKAIWTALRGMFTTKPTSQGEGGHLGLPAEFLVAPDGRIVSVHYGTHAADHWSVDDLLRLATSAG